MQLSQKNEKVIIGNYSVSMETAKQSDFQRAASLGLKEVANLACVSNSHHKVACNMIEMKKILKTYVGRVPISPVAKAMIITVLQKSQMWQIYLQCGIDLQTPVSSYCYMHFSNYELKSHSFILAFFNQKNFENREITIRYFFIKYFCVRSLKRWY